MASKFKPLVLYATDFYKLSSLLVRRVLLTKPANLAAYKEKTKQLLLDQSRPSSASFSSSSSPNFAAVKLLHWDKEFGLVQYYGVQEYARRWLKSRSSYSSSTTSPSISQATEQVKVGGTSSSIKNNNNVARVAFMITSEQRQRLSVDLGYTQQDIRSFKPIESLLLIENKVKKTSDDNAQYNFRDRLKELIDENENFMAAEQRASSSGGGGAEEFKEEKRRTVSPEEAEHAHVKADVAMALLLAEKGDDQKIEGLSAAKEEEIVNDTPINDTGVTSSAVALIDDDDTQKEATDTSTKSKAKGKTVPASSPPLSVKVTPNDSTELHMKPDVAAAFISSHLQNEETRSGMSDINDNEEEEDGPCWYEVTMIDADDEKEEEQEVAVVVALFATKKEALECVDIKKRLASGNGKRFSVRRRWNV